LILERHRAADERDEHHHAGAQSLGPNDHGMSNLVNENDQGEAQHQRERRFCSVSGDAQRHRCAGDGKLC